MSDAPTPRLRLEPIRDLVVVSFNDPEILDEVTIQEVGEQLYGLVERQGKTRILLNFRDVRYMASGVLIKLFNLKKKLDDRGGQLAFCCIEPDLMTPFQITHLDKQVPIFDDEPSALDRF